MQSQQDIIEFLIHQHQELKNCMEELVEAADRKDDHLDNVFQQFKQLFQKHDTIEDRIVYPLFKKYNELEKLVLKGYQAHHMVEVGILELRVTPYHSESWLPKFMVIMDSIHHHMGEEENELFPNAKKLVAKDEMAEMLTRAQEYK